MAWLDPPPGGLDGVYRRVRRNHLRRTTLAGLGAVGVTVGLLTGPLQNPLPPESRALLAQYRALEQRPGLRVIGGSALELTQAGSHSRVYLVATTANPDSDSDG